MKTTATATAVQNVCQPQSIFLKPQQVYDPFDTLMKLNELPFTSGLSIRKQFKINKTGISPYLKF